MLRKLSKNRYTCTCLRENVEIISKEDFKPFGWKSNHGTVWKIQSNLLSWENKPVTQSCPTLCDPMNHSTPGLPVHYLLPEFTQTHVHWVGDAIQLSHPLSSPSPPALSLPQHQGLCKRVIRWPKYWSFIFNISPSNEHLGLIYFSMDWWISLQSKGLSRIFSNTTVQKHQFFGNQLSL